MATADEILQQMEAEANAPVLTIDNDLRTIAIPDDVAILGVESDDDVHRLRFRMPKMCGEFDLSEFKLRVNIMNAGNEPDLYEVKDKAVEGEAITFSWLVGRTAAKYKGDVKFSVCAKLMDKDGVVQQEFNTTPAKLPVLEGLETSEAVVQLHPDIIEAILLRLSKLENSGGVSDEQIANALSAYLQEHPVEAGATKEQAEQIEANKKAIEELQKNGTGGGITEETDPTVPAWAKQPSKPTYTAAEVGALPATTQIPTVPETLPNPQPIVINGVSYDGSERKEITITAPDGGIATETDPTVPAWAKQPSKPTYTASEVGALPATTQIPTVPETLPNPQPIVINGVSYDGSVRKEITVQAEAGAGIDDSTPSTMTTYSSVKVDELINAQKEANAKQDNRLTALEQAGGGAENWELIAELTVEELSTSIHITTDSNGQPFILQKAAVEIAAKAERIDDVVGSGAQTCVLKINGKAVYRKVGNNACGTENFVTSYWFAEFCGNILKGRGLLKVSEVSGSTSWMLQDQPSRTDGIVSFQFDTPYTNVSGYGNVWRFSAGTTIKVYGVRK